MAYQLKTNTQIKNGKQNHTGIAEYVQSPKQKSRTENSDTACSIEITNTFTLSTKLHLLLLSRSDPNLRIDISLLTICLNVQLFSQL